MAEHGHLLPETVVLLYERVWSVRSPEQLHCYRMLIIGPFHHLREGVRGG